ncbi:ADP-ribosyltransferase [uncultured Fibrobacter sp.]|uniref:ADP-ribosyltransferase n=1 Tax=uncultured Fibrobacter sp. TaxID=261512 RepID=UPI0028042CDA|nr:ADP-ribosyltransferase [uncultured Fibrobacter sp.]
MNLDGKSLGEVRKAIVGKTATEKAFLSTGSSEGTGFKKDVTYHIFAPKGTKAAYLEPISRYGDGTDYDKWDGKKRQTSVNTENETLFQRGTKLHITKVEKIGQKWHIYADVVGQ